MTRRAERRPRPQRGQVLALMLLLLAALIGSFLFVFNSGQIVAAKVRLIGGADAAAHSGAQWQARALNFQAYMNRGIVANEVAIAQLVSLRSWSAYMNQVLQKAATVSTLVPPLGAPLRVASRSWTAMNRGLQRALPPLEAVASHWNVDVLSRAEYAAHAQAAGVVEGLAQRVAVANVPELDGNRGSTVFAAANAARWAALTTGHGREGQQRERLRAVVLDSRDGFTASRRWTLGLSQVSLRKRGGTDLIGYDDWRGMDTLALRTPGIFGASETPLAWDAAEDRRAAVVGRGEHGGSYRDNPRTSRNAERGLRAAGGYAGLPAYRDVRAIGPGSDPRLRFEFEARQPGASIGTSDVVMGSPATMVPGTAEAPVRPAYHSGNAYALAAAQVYFRRPVGRADAQRELGSLFNPYWQARLAPVTRAQRLLAAGARGGPADPWLAVP